MVLVEQDGLGIEVRDDNGSESDQPRGGDDAQRDAPVTNVVRPAAHPAIWTSAPRVGGRSFFGRDRGIPRERRCGIAGTARSWPSAIRFNSLRPNHLMAVAAADNVAEIEGVATLREASRVPTPPSTNVPGAPGGPSLRRPIARAGPTGASAAARDRRATRTTKVQCGNGHASADDGR